MSSVSVKDSTKDLVSVESVQIGGRMTTFVRSSSRLLVLALVLTSALAVGLLVGLIVVASRPAGNTPAATAQSR